MKRFVFNIVLFTVIISAVSAGLYWLVNRYYMPKGENIAYVWGDSQTLHGLDLQYLSAHTKYKFYSAAAIGAGLYDFLVFTEMVPENSNVVIGISRPVLLRKKKYDRNSSAINLSSMSLLMQNNYSLSEVHEIFMNNLRPHRIFDNTNTLYDNCDTILNNEVYSIFKDVYAARPAYFSDKQALYLAAIENLEKKHCHITAIEFPNHEVLTTMEDRSGYAAEVHSFMTKLSAHFTHAVAINIPGTPNIFYDYTHLNGRGAKYLSEQLVPIFEKGGNAQLVQVGYTDEQ